MNSSKTNPAAETIHSARVPAPAAAALLTEAMQLCRALAAEFQDNPDYKSRLADLLKLQSDHFGQKLDRIAQPRAPNP